jgi:ribosomal protein S18 acetylase RimI-like enzyme
MNLKGSIARDKEQQERKFLVALNETDNEVVGYAHAMEKNREDYELLRIYVLPQYQGKGIGKQLLQELKNQIKNLKKIKAWVEKENQIGRSFYENKGFQMVEEKLEVLGDLSTQLICYELNYD